MRCYIQIDLLFGLFFLSTLSSYGYQKRPDMEIQQRIYRVENGLLPEVITTTQTIPYMNLTERMNHFKVHGVSIAVINEGKIEWAKAYGVVEKGTQDSVTTQTLFQAGSISKAIAAMAALHWVEKGKLDLDKDVNKKLLSWKVPENKFTLQEKVTLRRILSHSAGLSVRGYPGYADHEQIPTVIQLLNGEKPAKSKPVRVDTIPGSRFSYSGGGYVVLQQLLMDITGKPFPDLMRSTVLSQLKMIHSTYEQPLPEKLSFLAASGHQENGEVEPGKWRTLPMMAAGGLWSTPTDIAKFVIDIQQSLHSESHQIISQQMAEKMVQPHSKDQHTTWGLGVKVGGEGREVWFEHGGLTDGYICEMIGFNHTGQGLVIMTNSQSSFPLIMEIVRSVAQVYKWPAFQAKIESSK